MSSTTSQQSMGPTPTRLRQIALVVEDLGKARHLLTKTIGAEVIFVDPGVEQWGLKNILVAIGGDIIEVVSPFKPNTTAGRLLSKRGDGGYMIIMQTSDARARRNYLESTKQAKCIFTHEAEDSVCVQYHPKGIKGGMLPELDSHTPSTTNPTPLTSRFSPWHAAGPLSTHSTYSAGMKRQSHLHLLSATLRLSPNSTSPPEAAKQWQDLFGVKAWGLECWFTNAKLVFIEGEEGKGEGLVEIEIGVEGEERLREIFERARGEGLSVDEREGAFEMLGTRWRFVVVEKGLLSRL